jgi:hypothetical protein
MNPSDFNVEYFEDWQTAIRFANDPVRSEYVLGVYGNNGKTFREWIGHAIACGMSLEHAEKMAACVVWTR